MTSQDSPTGAAYITVNSNGENTISVVSGANSSVPVIRVGQSITQALKKAKEPITIALAQGETSADATEAFADPLIVNEGEARILVRRFTGFDTTLVDPKSALLVAQLLAERVSAAAIITLGAEGAVGAGVAAGSVAASSTGTASSYPTAQQLTSLLETDKAPSSDH